MTVFLLTILLLSPFRQVAGEVLAKADDAPVLSVIDPIEGFGMGQVHLSILKYLKYCTLYSNLIILC